MASKSVRTVVNAAGWSRPSSWSRSLAASAAESIRDYDHLSWKKYAARRLQAYLELVPRGLGSSSSSAAASAKKADEFMPKIELLTPIVPAGLHDDAGIIGAALDAPAG